MSSKFDKYGLPQRGALPFVPGEVPEINPQVTMFAPGDAVIPKFANSVGIRNTPGTTVLEFHFATPDLGTVNLVARIAMETQLFGRMVESFIKHLEKSKPPTEN